MRQISTTFLVILATTLSPWCCHSFTPRPFFSKSQHTLLFADGEVAADSTTNDLNLTPELLKVTNAFESIGDDKLRYKQLLYMANQLKPIDPALQTPENKVPGCLSTVHIHATLVDELVEYAGESDGLLTKGLVALLIRGLNGNSPQAIQKVDPAFIKKAGISASLTPGRNNGFLNMLAVMKKKALELEGQAPETAKQEEQIVEKQKVSSDRPKYDAMMDALQKLQPAHLELTDNSHEHAGHKGNDIAGESHFELAIVADAFDGLNLVKRHKLIYMMLGEIMPEIHALQIRAQTPSEAGM
jgi:sulfur transfer protein SufE/stress-induced morphogen